MGQKFANNARALLTGSINAAATSLTVEALKADRFPIGTTASWGAVANWFRAALIDSAGNVEIIKVGTRTGGSNTFSVILRAQEGTTAIDFAAGSFVVSSVTAADIENALAGSVETLTVTGTDPITAGGVQGRCVPLGGIIMWSGSVADIDAGYQLCDGTNGTPDLRDKFVIGAKQDDSGTAKTNVTGALTQSGGSKDAIVPAHAHGATFAGTALAAHGHTVNETPHSHDTTIKQYTGAAGSDNSNYGSASATGITTGTATTGITVATASAGTPAGTVAVASTGVSVTNANLVPYYALAFIQCMA